MITQNNSLLCLLILLITIMNFSNSSSAVPTFIVNDCSNKTMFANNSRFHSNLNTVFRHLATKASNNEGPSHFNTAIAGEDTSDTVYGLYICVGYQHVSTCQDCVDTATRTDLPKTYCPNRKVAIMWYDECMVRYSNESFFGMMDLTPIYIMTNTQNVSNDVFGEFRDTVHSMLNSLIKYVLDDQDKYSTIMVSVANASTPFNIYGMAQCTPDLTTDACSQCLNGTIKVMPIIARGARTLWASCFARYETYPFYNFVTDNNQTRTRPTIIFSQPELPLSPPVPAPSPIILKTPPAKTAHSPPPPRGNERKRKMERKSQISMYISIPLLVILSVVLCFSIRRCWYKRKATETFNIMGMEEIIAVESLQFDLNTIRLATSNFSASNKLGEGGFGEVYKGKLEGGQEIAVKRLSRNSTQGIAEFKTEVILVAKLQHKNLVKLLGFCVASMETILVYEFLTNSSLDRLLFEPTKRACLDWQTRFKIILGVARGLQYLHEDSRLKVVHRDLKSSNILLDEGMEPKISDFGLAKLFGVDETQGDTKRIVGTYGYMAPEYAITGHYSVKSDVYSFGVLLLEIVSGQRNRLFRPQQEEALLHRAWRLWMENKALDLVDTTLCNFPGEQLMQCIHIGLLCIQEDAFERPRMALIVAALNGHSVSLSPPKAPHFFRSGTSAENSNALDEYNLTIYTGGEQMTEVYSRD